MNRTINLLNAFGFQGGTIHQVAELTGCDAFDLLHTDPFVYDIDYAKGWFAYRTNSRDFNKEHIKPKYLGNVQFWLGVVSGAETTRKSQERITAKF